MKKHIACAILMLAACKKDVAKDTGSSALDASLAASHQEPVVRFVTASTTVRYVNTTSATTAIERLEIGTRLEVLAPTTSAWGHPLQEIIAGGSKHGGFVAADDLGDVRPSAQQYLDLAIQELQKGKITRSKEQALLAAQLDVADPRPLELLAAITDREGDVDTARNVYAKLKALGATTKPKTTTQVANSTTAAVAGGHAWVGATRLFVRASPKPDARVVAELVINRSVSVESIKGTWAKIAAEPDPIEFQAMSETSSTSKVIEEKISGWVAASFLSGVRLVRERFVAAADAHEKGDRISEALQLLERAAMIDERDPDLLARLVRLSSSVRNFKVAVAAAQEIGFAGEGEMPDVEIKLFYGCDEVLQKSAVLNFNEITEHCLENVALQEPCREEIGYDDGLERGEDESDKDYEERLRDYQIDRDLRQNGFDREYEQAMDEFRAHFERDTRRYTASRHQVHLHISSMHTRRPQKLFVYALPVTRSVWECDFVIAPLKPEILETIPPPREGATKDVWIEVNQYADVIYGIVPAESEEAALQLFESKTGADDRPPAVIAPGVSIQPVASSNCDVACGC